MLMLYIWELRATQPARWIAILGLLVLLHLVHREEYSRLGFGRCDWKDLMIEVGRPLALLGLLLTACGLLLHTMRPIRLGGAGPLHRRSGRIPAEPYPPCKCFPCRTTET